MKAPSSQKQLIAFLASMVLHLVLLIGMAIWTILTFGNGDRLSIQGGVASADAIAEVVLPQVETQPDELMSDASFGFDPSTTSLSLSETISFELLTETPTEPTSITSSSIAELVQRSGKENAVGTFVGMSIEARQPKNRAVVGPKNGATPASEQAVERALKYLAAHQSSNGSWGTQLTFPPCLDRCSHGSEGLDTHTFAATGLSLLCFLSAGHTLSEGEYSEVVRRGVYFLVERIKIIEGRGIWLTSAAKSEMYEHGIATLALCEALQTSEDKSLQEACQAAISFIVYAQGSDGGWDYHPRGSGDLSIVGWQVMALKSAVAAKLQVPTGTIRSVDLFLKRNASGPFMYRYRQATDLTASMTAIGNLIRVVRGVTKTDPVLARCVEYLTKTGPSLKDMYYNYYATQLMFHYGGPAWDFWNRRMRDYLVQTQEKEGHMAGSWWFPADISNLAGGRIYTTAMACLTLEVYYRYLPVYEETVDFKL